MDNFGFNVTVENGYATSPKWSKS